MSTLDFYNENASEYFNRTFEKGNTLVLDEFISRIPSNGIVFDIGCGSGRDSIYMTNKGLNVIPIDNSRGLIEEAFKRTNLRVLEADIRTKDFGLNWVDGVWANASLVHLSEKEFLSVISRLYRSLKYGGLLYISLKKHNEEDKESIEIVDNEGRFFTKYDENYIKRILKNLNIEIDEMFLSESTIGDDQTWINIFIKKN